MENLPHRNHKIIPARNPGDPFTFEGRTYSLNCNGEVGDMLYLTDLDYTESGGHNLAEVEIFVHGSGENHMHSYTYN